MLEVSDLVVRYGGVIALEGVSMSFESGVVTTIIGSNGAGKTSLLKAILGMVKISKGSIIFEGEQLNGLQPEQIVSRGVVLVPEGRRLFPRMSVRDNLLTGAHLIRDAKKVKTTLEKVFTYFSVLGQRQKQMAGTMSGGEQQMLAIGRGLMAKPRMLLLDEPSTGLAPLMVKEVMEAVARLVEEEKLGVLLVEQNATVALAGAKIAYVLETGRIALSGLASVLASDERIQAAYLGL